MKDVVVKEEIQGQYKEEGSREKHEAREKKTQRALFRSGGEILMRA